MSGRRLGIAPPFLATRGALLLVGLLASRLLVSGLTLQKGNLVYHRPGPVALEVWARWDAEWYLLIAEQGYHSDAFFLDRPVAYSPEDATGFFPLYPLLTRVGTLLGLSALCAGVLVSNLALLLGLWFLRDLAARDFGEDAAEAALWVLVTFPTSFFLSAVYAESLMLAGALGALRAARDGRPWAAGLWGAIATLARPTGILVMVPLVDELLLARRAHPGPRGASRLAALAIPPGALAGYMLYCRASFGSFAPFLARQERWRGAFSGPWRAFTRYLEAPHLHDAHHSTIDLAFALFLVASIPFLFRRLPRSYALYGALAILLPLCSTLWSFARFAATVFPVTILIALWAARSRGRLLTYLATALPLSGFFMALYAAWWWVG